MDGVDGKNRHANAVCYKCYKKGHMNYNCKVKKENLKCDFCHTTGRHNSNEFCKNKQKKDKGDKGDSVQKVESKTPAAKTKTPAGTPSVSDSSDNEDDNHSGQAVYCATNGVTMMILMV